MLYFKTRIKVVCLHIILLLFSYEAFSQRYLSDYDSTLFIRDTVRPVVKRFENLHISGYMQPQFQVAQEKGVETYAGSNFLPNADNRFMLRRARVKMDYRAPGKNGDFPAALFTFQFEATERDVNVRDVFVRIYEPSQHNFSVTAGLFARPFGYEVNLSSSFRETPERGRMSQILMPSERDLGTMISYESQRKGRKNPQLKYDVGVFNGQGKSGPAEFDSYKDVISRLALKPMPLTNRILLSAGLSFLYGGWVQATRYKYEMGERNGGKAFLIDSSLSNIGDRAPRHYYGADAQLVIKNGWCKTELRAEYWKGTQPGTASTTVNPGTLPIMPTYIRNFDGAFVYFLQNIINKKWELMVKYDWYDPNTKVAGKEVGINATNLGETDIRFNTLGFGLTYYMNDNVKVLGYYDRVKNEATSLDDYTQDVKDNVFTLRVQFRF
jgi:hypothetical protein